MVVVAVGAGPNRALFEGAAGLERNERGYIRTFTESCRTSLQRVWAGGDIVTGSATVILAMGAARKAADDIHAFLGVRRAGVAAERVGCGGRRRRSGGARAPSPGARSGSPRGRAGFSASSRRWASSCQ